ncbi:MAG TPA: hypothetical protein DG753_07890 [Clostridium sp.]|nr:hypothetical protein [Clostridium sp.]
MENIEKIENETDNRVSDNEEVKDENASSDNSEQDNISSDSSEEQTSDEETKNENDENEEINNDSDENDSKDDSSINKEDSESDVNNTEEDTVVDESGDINEDLSSDEGEQPSEDSEIVTDNEEMIEDNEVLEDAEQQEELEDVDFQDEEVDESEAKSVGKLEVDMNFPMPLIDNDNLDIQIKLLKDNEEVGVLDLSKGIIVSDLDKDKNSNMDENTKNRSKELNFGITYKIEKFNYKRELINKDNESIYYVKVTFENLEKDVYGLKVSGSGYSEINVEDIDIIDYSKRVKIGSGSTSGESTGYKNTFLGGDVNNDSVIDMEDYQIVFDKIVSKNKKSDLNIYDLNRDGKIDVADLSVIYENLGQSAEKAQIENTNKIIDVDEVKLESNADFNGSSERQVIEDILLKDNSVVQLGLKNDEGEVELPSKEKPLTLSFDLESALGSSKRRINNSGIEMEQIVIKAPTRESENASSPEEGYITYIDENGEEQQVNFSADNSNYEDSEDSRAKGKKRSSSNDIVIDLGKQVAVKQISINVTANRGNKAISQIAKIEFLNNVYKEVPKPDMNIPEIKTVETSTEMHDERITISWEPEANVTSYEVKYDKLNENGQVIKSKKLQTNKTNLNILDKDIKPYDIYRVSIQSINGEWESGYEEETSDHKGYDGKPDNVDSNYNPIESYYKGDIGKVTEIQVIPQRSPEQPRNLTTVSGYKSFTVSWEDHRQAREFDIYYRKVGESNWIKANETDENGERLIVSENSSQVTNPNKDTLVRSHSYVVNKLEDNTTYEVRVTATNHLGTSKMSQTYLASTVSMQEPDIYKYKLINKPTSENKIGVEHIIDVVNKTDADGGWDVNDTRLTVDSKYAVVDGDFSTSLKCNDWDMGAYYGANRGSEITFDKEYKIGKIILTKCYEQGFGGWFGRVKVTYWDEEGNKNVVITESINTKTSNGQQYHEMKLETPINAKKIKVETGGGGWQTISELMFYEYDSIEDDIKDLYSDPLRLKLKDDVTQEKINTLVDRVNTKDVGSDEYHPDRDILLKELENAQKLFDDKDVSVNIKPLDASIRTDNVGPSLGMENSYQSLGAVARPNGVNAEKKEKIVVYMGSSDKNTTVDITFIQNYGQPGQYISRVTTIRPGVTEIEVPTIFNADVEKGGQVMARVTGGSTNADVKIRLSGVEEIPHLNVNNIINDVTKKDEVKEKIRKYIRELKAYVNELPSKYPDEVSATDKENNIYTYEKTTSVLNTTDIEGDRFTLTLPATEILAGIEENLNGNEELEVNRVYDALLAWEQEMKVSFAKKGVFEEVQDFSNNGEIDDEDRGYFNKHKVPLTRLNVKYQRMMMGAAAYASSHHIGVGFGASSYIQGVPYKFDEKGNVINRDEAKLYGTLMGHEIGHAMDISERLYPETSNNLLASITNTMLNEDNPQTSGAMKELYNKVTSNTIGLSTNRSVVLGMLWQPYLAYEDNETYEMLSTDFDSNISDDSYFAKLNRAYREMSQEEKANGDRDQYLIRMTSKVVEKDLSDFYIAHGIIPNEKTIEYVSQFEKETRPVQYINDEARRMRLAGKADMEEGTTLSASYGADEKGNEVKAGSYVNSKEVKINLSVNKSKDKILGYEIYRNGLPCGFITRDESNSETVFIDTIDSLNNRVVNYKAVAYDYNLKATNEVELGSIKVRHDGGVAKSSSEITSNTVSVNEESNDIHGCTSNQDLKFALDNDDNTYYEGRMLEKNEYNSSIYDSEMDPKNNPYIILDTNEIKTLVGIKYTAPVQESGLIFRKTSVLDSALKKYKIEVSKDGQNWTSVKTGTLEVNPEKPTETIYFDAEGVTGGKQLNSYNARYVKITALDSKKISAAELELITPPGDNIEIGVSDDKGNYKNGIGLLKEDYVYELDNPETEENEYKFIPKGSVIITGEYRGNPAFNVPLVLNQNEENIADKYTGLLFAHVPDNGNLEEIAEGNWIYFVEPQYVEAFKADNKKIFAELYRTDSADALEGGQRLVSDTFEIEVPEELPEISLSKTTAYRQTNDLRTIRIDKNRVGNILDAR